MGLSGRIEKGPPTDGRPEGLANLERGVMM